MTKFLLPPGFRATDDDDNPLAAGYYRFYNGGTTTPKAVYADAGLSISLGTTVNLNSAGEPVTGSNVQTMIYLNTGTYRVRLYDADDTIILDQDGIPGSEEEAAVSTTGLPIIPVDSKTGAYTVVVGDRGNLINCNPTGGSFTVTLPSAVTVGDNFVVGFRHNGTANQVSIVSTSSQTIRGAKNVTSYALINQGDTAWFISDGSDWIVASRAQKAPALYRVLDSLAAPPVSPAAGAMYRIDGTPTGQWSTLGFADEDLAEADGNGSWIRHTPESGWIVFDVDVEEFLKFTEGQWGPLLVPPEPSTLATAVFEHQLSANTVGGTASAAAWTKRTLNTSVQNDIDGCSLSSSQITLPPGKYAIDAWQSFYNTRTTLSRLSVISGTATPTLTESSVHHFIVVDGSLSGGTAEMAGTIDHSVIMTVTVEAVIELQYYVGSSNGTSDLGLPKNNAEVERYACVRIVDLSAQQGPQGDEGNPGVDGPPGALQYQFNTATSGDPGSGKILINNASPVSATALHVSETDANSADLSALVSIFDDSSSAKKALVLATKIGEPDNVMVFRITAAGTDQGGYWTFPIEYVAHDGSFGNANDLAFVVIPTGDKGDTGNNGPTGSTAFDFDDATADADPGDGEFRLNHATPASATEVYFDNLNNGGESVAAWLDTFDDSGNSTLRGYLHLFDAVDPTTIFHVYAVSGSVTDGTGYRKITIAHVVGAGTFTNGNEILAAFFARGPAGSGLADVVDDTTPQLGGALDANGFNIDFDDNTGIRDDSGNEQLIFQKTASAVNHVEMTNAATGNHPSLAAVGDDTNINLDLAAKGSGKVRVAGSPALKASGNETLTAGFAATSIDDGTKSTGTFTPVFLDGNVRRYVNGGAHILAPPSGEGVMTIQVTNNGSAGAITTSGFTKVSGDTITTTNGHDFFFDIRVVNGFSQLHVTALQ
jgi:hypothetical protein